MPYPLVVGSEDKGLADLVPFKNCDFFSFKFHAVPSTP